MSKEGRYPWGFSPEEADNFVTIQDGFYQQGITEKIARKMRKEHPYNPGYTHQLSRGSIIITTLSENNRDNGQSKNRLLGFWYPSPHGKSNFLTIQSQNPAFEFTEEQQAFIQSGELFHFEHTNLPKNTLPAIGALRRRKSAA